MIDWNRLDRHADDLRQTFAVARPFPHVVIDGLFDRAELAQAVSEWPGHSEYWRSNQRGKRGMIDLAAIPPRLGKVISGLNSAHFVRWLAALTQISDLTADPTLSGAGLHEITPGGSLQMHVDFNRLGDLYRRLNVLLYLNHDWEDEWGGHLELVNHPKKTRERVVIAPAFNRLVIAESSERSWHGHPHPLNCPDGVSRKSIALYFYSRDPHPSYKADHSTEYAINRESLREENRKWARGRERED
jgi:Rps23 Pro-64 3,4-dihydroxylase Tpa1-like proline 4-hydroxylase